MNETKLDLVKRLFPALLFSWALLMLLYLSAAPALLADTVGGSFYEPSVRDIEGWTVKVDPKFLLDENEDKADQFFDALANHLQRVKYVVIGDSLGKLQSLPIWVEWAGRGPGLVYHPNSRWLEKNGYNPAMARHVHVPNVDLLLDRRQWSKHPYAIMHELAHAYHDQVLGWDEARIKVLFDAAKNSGGYDQVLNHAHRTVKHYGMNNHKEYFAEATEAYLGVNDFYPFVRAELKKHDPRMFKFLGTIWGEF